MRAMKTLFFLFLIVNINLCFGKNSSQERRSEGFVAIEDMVLSRKGTVVDASYLAQYPHAHFGFIWNKEDNHNKNWRPQGITGFEHNNKQYLLVSWYNKKRFFRKNFGARLSLVEINGNAFVNYQHILLVDNAQQPLTNIHAGGIAYFDGTIYLTDSRKNKFQILEFDINSIEKSAIDGPYKTHYLLKQKSSWPISLKPSFMSLSPINHDLLIGSFNKCKNIFANHKDVDSCLANNKNALSLHKINNNHTNIQHCFPLFSEMQGATYIHQPHKTSDMIWIVSSWGRKGISHLHIGLLDWDACINAGVDLSAFTVIDYPPGLENIYITNQLNEAWLLTEFGPHEGDNNRTVFSIALDELWPE